MIRLVAIADPSYTADGLRLQSKVLWEAAEVQPWRTGGSPPRELPWEGPSNQSQALLLAVDWHKYDRTPVWSAILTTPPPGVRGGISSYCSATAEWSAYQYTYQEVAPVTHTRAITISLLALRAVEMARAYQGESTIVIPDQTLVSLLESRRPY